MDLYQMKSNPLGHDRIEQFLRDNFVSIGFPGIGDLESLGRAALEERLRQAYPGQEQKLNEWVHELRAFVHEMQDGDHLLVAHEEIVYLGDVGDYYYVEAFDSETEGTCHRRGVTWLAAIRRAELNAKVLELLDLPGAIARFQYSYSAAQLKPFVLNGSTEKIAPVPELATSPCPPLTSVPVDKQTIEEARLAVDKQTIEEALSILKQAMSCEDAERRERAAIAILQYAKGPLV